MHQFKQWIILLGSIGLMLGGCGHDEQKAAAPPQPLDVSQLNIISVQELDLLTGPLRITAYLAPDGQHFAYINGDGLCIYTLSGERVHGFELGDRLLKTFDSETVRWSPDSRYLTIGIHLARYPRIADIWVADTTAGTLSNLTEEEIANEPRWIDCGARFVGKKLVFIRYPADAEGVQVAAVMSINPDGSALQEIGTLTISQALSVLALAPAPDQKSWAFNYLQEDTDDPDQGVWLVNARFQNPRQIGAITSTPWWIEFSPDGQYLMTYADELQIYKVEDGRVFLADQQYLVRSGAWAPSGHALVYLVNNKRLGEENGLYLSAGPGEPGRLVLPGMFLPPTARGRQPLMWASSNTILLGSVPPDQTIIVQLGEGESNATLEQDS